jgi:hypothetical protein
VSQRPDQPEEIIDPTCCDDVASTEVKAAWAAFVKSGRYRMAQRKDMHDSEAMSRRPFAYTWGNLGYTREQSQRYHLAVIVVDTTRASSDRFGVVIFSAPSGGKGVYKVYWLMRDRDLANAFFSGYSGYLELVDQTNRSNGCDIYWNSRMQKYACRP